MPTRIIMLVVQFVRLGRSPYHPPAADADDDKDDDNDHGDDSSYDDREVDGFFILIIYIARREVKISHAYLRIIANGEKGPMFIIQSIQRPHVYYILRYAIRVDL